MRSPHQIAPQNHLAYLKTMVVLLAVAQSIHQVQFPAHLRSRLFSNPVSYLVQRAQGATMVAMRRFEFRKRCNKFYHELIWRSGTFVRGCKNEYLPGLMELTDNWTYATKQMCTRTNTMFVGEDILCSCIIRWRYQVSWMYLAKYWAASLIMSS